MSKNPSTDGAPQEYRFGIAGGSVVGQDLNQLLVRRPESTFYLKMAANNPEFNLQKSDILMIDRSITPKKNNLVVITDENDFHVARFLTDQPIWGVITYVIHQQR